ncbi:hypothetical protein [Phycisphaera mikurensis]|uniref:Uncharacterized protein n=1 Tax=Phycisphaera mikurensis (strain NBRC 102666 / KCTC 22515 / FYK2301M01) TaxID=1142394 RepID=I0IG26_PHYMF|nr:hypothetical protein [Phycisphaera mikurensis]MBB6440402.1 hypothetical protein [Phycisphaera mikurensis]BAM04214.1 hypothetical protein PSMK_20550 [Phycisphaera mikurensis NBRC 102666]
MLDSLLFGSRHARTIRPVADAGGRADAARARTEAGQANREAAANDDRLDRLSLVCMAMWSLLQEKTGLTEEDLLQRVELLDLMDGEADGKATVRVRPCPTCDRPLGPRHKKCIYCGAERPGGSAFDNV